MTKLNLFLLFFLGIISISFAQKRDTLDTLSDSVFIETNKEIEIFEEQSTLDPNRSVLLSAIVPGLGQIYNRQYWKVPIVVTGFVVFGHLINHHNKRYHAMRNALLLNIQGKTNPFESRINGQDNLLRLRDAYRRQRDFMIILGTVFYLLQIVDAHVAAHLDEFNVNEKLSLQVAPSFQRSDYYSQNVGLSLVLKF